MPAGPPTVIVTVVNGATIEEVPTPSGDPIPGATVYLIIIDGNVPNGDTNATAIANANASANANVPNEQSEDTRLNDTTDGNGRTIFRFT